MDEAAATRASLTPQKLMQLQTLRRRRRRVWRNVAAMLVVTLIMAVLSIAERDNQSLRGSVQGCYADLEHACGVLQADFDRGAPAPALLPLPAEPEPLGLSPSEHEKFQERQVDRRLRYLYFVGHRGQVRPDKPALVCQDVQMHDLYLRQDQLHVILFDGRRYELRTLNRGDLPHMVGTPGWTPPK